MSDLTCWCYNCKIETEWEWLKDWQKYECSSCGTFERSDWPNVAAIIRGTERSKR